MSPTTEEYVDPQHAAHARRGIHKPALIERLRHTFQMLADPTRIRLVLALGAEELCVSDLARLLGVTAPTVSHQLRLLRHLGLVRPRREGKLIYYRLDDPHLTHWLGEGLEHLGVRPARRRAAVGRGAAQGSASA
jgi:DNA-binding transcriptional ArsR family regulator